MSEAPGYDALVGPKGFTTPRRPIESSVRLIPGANYGQLLGKFGEGELFMLGGELSFRSQESGELWLAINNNVDFFWENQGELAVTLQEEEDPRRGVMSEEKISIEEAHRHFARSINREVWDLLELDSRDSQQDRLILDAAHASLYHWKQVGQAVHRQRGEWLLCRVHTALEQPAEAIRHAQRCYELTQAHPEQMEDFDLAFAEEAMVRALASSGELKQANIHWAHAKSLGDGINDDEDREIFLRELESGDWYGLV